VPVDRVRRTPPGTADGSGGFLTVQYLLAVGLSLVLLAQLMNLLVVSYGRGAVRAALDEGVRAAAVVQGDAGQCRARAEEVLADLLGGTMGSGVGPVGCSVTDDRVRAQVAAVFPAWLPGMPPFTFGVQAEVVREGAP
jgi:hypothetical protein